MEERTIDIRDMFLRTLLHWKAMIVAAVIGAVLMDCYSYYGEWKAYNTYQEQLEQGQTVSEATLESMKENLTSKEIANAENAAMMYAKYKSNSETQKVYNDNSLLMQLDPQNVTRLTYTFYVDNGYKVEYPIVEKYNNIHDIMNAFQNNLTDADICGKIMSALNIETENNYILEMYTVTATDSTLRVSVLGRDINYCKSIMGVITSKIDEVKSDLSKTYGVLTVTQQSDKVTSGIETSVMNTQTTALNNYNNARNNMINAGSKLTSSEMEYYEALTSNVDEVQEVRKPTVFAKKMFLFGLVGGIIIVFLFFAGAYLVSGSIKSNDDYEMYGIKTIGTIWTEKSKKGIGGWIYSKLSREERSVNEQIEHIATMMKNIDGVEEIVIATSIKESDNNIIEEINNLFKEKEIVISAVGSLIKDGNILNRVKVGKKVLFIEKLGESSMTELERAVNICKVYDEIELFGVLIG